MGLLTGLQKRSRGSMRAYQRLAGVALSALLADVILALIVVPRIENAEWLGIALTTSAAAVIGLGAGARYLHSCSLRSEKDFEQSARDIARLAITWQNRDSYDETEFEERVNRIVDRPSPKERSGGATS